MDVTEKSESPISELKWLLVSFSAKFFLNELTLYDYSTFNNMSISTP